MNKTLITFFTLLFCLTSSVGWSETMDDLVERDGVHYKKFTQVPFTGEVTGKEQGSFKNGKKEGFWTEYWKNGQLFSKGDFKNGKKEGSWVGYEEDGSLDKRWTGTFKDGIKISE